MAVLSGSWSSTQTAPLLPKVDKHHVRLHPNPSRLTREDVLDGLPISTVLEYARRGLLPGHKLGRRWIFLCDEIEAAVRGRLVDRSAA